MLTFLNTSGGFRLRFPLTFFQSLVQCILILLAAASPVFLCPSTCSHAGSWATMRTVGSAQELCSDVSALLQQGGGFPGKSGFVPVALWCSAVLDKLAE